MKSIALLSVSVAIVAAVAVATLAGAQSTSVSFLHCASPDCTPGSCHAVNTFPTAKCVRNPLAAQNLNAFMEVSCLRPNAAQMCVTMSDYFSLTCEGQPYITNVQVCDVCQHVGGGFNEIARCGPSGMTLGIKCDANCSKCAVNSETPFGTCKIMKKVSKPFPCPELIRQLGWNSSDPTCSSAQHRSVLGAANVCESVKQLNGTTVYESMRCN